MSDLPRRLRDDLTAAMRERDRATAGVLRTALSAIANAEAIPPAGDATSPLAEGRIAGAASGLAATEADRRVLGPAEVHAIVAAERDERLASADDLAARGAHQAADGLRAEAAVLARYLV